MNIEKPRSSMLLLRSASTPRDLSRRATVSLLAVAAAGLAACFAAPTPHPAKGEDSAVTGNYTDVLSDSGQGGASYADACAVAGGRWDDGRGVCELDFSAGVDPNYATDRMDASAAPGGDEGGALGADATGTQGGNQDVDAGAEPTQPPAPTGATVTAVTSAGSVDEAGGYTFSVTIESPDLGCDQYADWWEVVRPNGTLVYRRVMRHSHVDEQPFTRDGGPIMVEPGDVVVVRAHMHGAGVGYGGEAMVGTPRGGFAPTALPDGFAWGLVTSEPLPEACAP